MSNNAEIGIVAERIRAAVQGNDDVRARFAAGSVVLKIDTEPSAGAVALIIATTGLPARLLLSTLDDIDRGLDDFPGLDAHR